VTSAATAHDSDGTVKTHYFIGAAAEREGVPA
jgi:hypothetical protein